MRCKGVRGEITVFLTLLFFIVSALTLTVTESARAQAIRVQTERVMQTSIHSGFGEYNRELLSYYRLLAIDTSYRGDSGSVENLRAHLKEYAEENFRSSDPSDQKSDWLKLEAGDLTVKRHQLLSDENGGVLIDQAVKEMRAQGELENRADILRESQLMKRQDDSFMDRFSQAVSMAGNEESNPAAAVLDMASGLDLLHMVLRDAPPSSRMFSGCASKRSLQKGNCDGKFKLTDNGTHLFDAYLLQYFGTYVKPCDHAVFDCEIEYLIAGKGKEEDSCRECAKKILSQRLVQNLNGFEGNDEVIRKTEELADEICSLGYGDRYYTQRSLLYAWVYAESVVEVSRLLNGGRADMDGYSDPQVVPLEELTDFIGYCASCGGSGEDYEDYLTGLLALTATRTKALRCMDLIEMNIRRAGYGGFQTDTSVTYFQAEMRVNSGYGHSCRIEREYGYLFP